MEKHLDDERWMALYAECRASLFRAAALIVGEADAEELVQDAFEHALRTPKFFENVREPRAWLRTTLVHLAVSRLRRHAVWERIRPRRDSFVEGPDAETVDLRRALLRLRPEERAAIVMHHYYGAPYAEIALALGVQVATIGKLLTRARRSLAALLTEPVHG